MLIETQRNLTISLLRDKRKMINLYEFSDEVREAEDIDDICAFLENYTTKYKFSSFDCDNKNGIFSKKSDLFPDIINSVRNLDAHGFEKLSAIICKCFGYDNFFATKKSHDQGIDFIACSPFEKLNIDYKNYAIGQSKHFADSLVATRDIRELAGSVILFSRNEFSTRDEKYKRFQLGTFTPTNVFFISNYFFSEDAENLCRTTNIIPLDIVDITCLCLIDVLKKNLAWTDKKGKFSRTAFYRDIQRVDIAH